ncbi:hypothetical protein AB0D57_41005 [Streptomyces sp. NPDC048275]|uniref:hypothetical protein n=1 Tax=Streptomyces sp. NPDC048275 TaxID=3155629 RepID=UPI0033D71654
MDLATEWKLSADLSGSVEGRFPRLRRRPVSAALFRGALVLTGNREAAEDLVQETLEPACHKWRTINTKDAPDAP